MLTRNPIVPENHVSDPVIDYELNQDQSCLVLSTPKRFNIYNIQPLKRITSQEMAQVSKIRMLHRTNYVAFVTTKKDVLHIWDDVKKQDVTRIKTASLIQNFFLSREFVITCQHDVISVYQFGTPWNKLTDDIKYGGVCEFASGLLVYSNEFNTGQIHIVRVNAENDQTLGKGVLIKAHKTPIHMVRLNKRGDMLASCSVDGTLVRIFQTENGTLIREFRRGLDRATIKEMRWSSDGSKLAVISDKWTLHVFEVCNDSENKRHVLKSWINLKYFQSEWGICNFKLDTDEGSKNCKVAWVSDTSLAVFWPYSRVLESFKLVFNREEQSWALRIEKKEKVPL